MITKQGWFLQPLVRYMGPVISSQGLHMDPDRVDDIMAVPPPKNRKKLKAFLGIINFVSRFIPNMSVTTALLRELLKKDTAWV